MTTLIREEAERGLAGMDPGRRGRYLAWMSEEDLTARYDLAERDGDHATMAILEQAIRDLYARQAAEAEHRERAAHWRENTLQGRAHTDAEREWWAAAEGEYRRAEAKCNVLLSAAGREECESAFPALWYATPAELDVWISDDLRHWLEHGELSITSWDEWRRHALWAEDRSHPRHEVREAGMEETATAPEAAPEPGTREWRLAQGHDPETVDAAERMKAASARRLAGGIAPGPAAGAAEAGERARASQAGTELATTLSALPVLPAPPPVPAITEMPEPRPFRYKDEHGDVVTVTGKAWLDYAAAFFGRYVYWPSEHARVVSVLWMAHTYVRETPEDGAGLIGSATPRIFYLSNKRNSGKSTALRLLALTCPRVFGIDTQPTEYGLLSSLHEEKPTLLIDEMGILLATDKRSLGVQQVLLNGYTPDGTKPRERNRRTERVGLFAPVALAGLDVVEKNPSENVKAILSRGFRIHMRPSPDGAEPADLDDEADYVRTVTGRIRLAGTGWVGTNREWLRRYRPPAVEGTHRRYRQICMPLAAIADAAGPEWSQRGREALAALQAAWVDEGGSGDGASQLEGMLSDLDAMQAELAANFGQGF